MRLWNIGLSASLVLALMSPAIAQEETPKWMVHADGGLVVIAFQVPDSDDVRFHVDCDIKPKRTRVTLYEEIKRTRVNQPVTIEIANGVEKVSLKGKTATDEMNGYTYAQASGIKLAPFLALLAKPGEVTAIAVTPKAKSDGMKLPDTGRADAVKEFAAKCSLP
ncbi:hypothetical protein GJW-30_1_00901 [Variibacter gotjawalensis]|uniref:Uncharacterized protein n=1 Tax=Variibacter gotjawalensis TaxID=1333996 RepID=A0A0S3PQZ3_9BRAD|nr:hypothetical protein [Variibacter gotjawalensis]NIK48681.1 molybdopterin-binding protein [Variibacter gotjawalensis]RZS50542.1 hypothetical protein EV661_3008 [Variibacter gotjawalensis]BAT58376.1 hypothetical protein GJW-30_1_00901 [Variibacter gotjawalensis]